MPGIKKASPAVSEDFSRLHQCLGKMGSHEAEMPQILHELSQLIDAKACYYDAVRNECLCARHSESASSSDVYEPDCPYQIGEALPQDRLALPTSYEYFFVEHESDLKTAPETCSKGAHSKEVSSKSLYSKDFCSSDSFLYALRIPCSLSQYHFLVVQTSSERLSQTQQIAIEQSLILMSRELYRMEAQRQKLFYQHNNVVHDLLLDRFSTHERIDAALRSLKVDCFPHYESLLVRTALADARNADRLDELQQLVQRRLRSFYPNLVYYVNSDRLVFLHNFGDGEPSIDLNKVTEVMDELHEQENLPAFYHIAVVSGQVGRYALAHSNNQLMDAYRLFDTVSYKNLCMRFDDLGIFKLLLGAPDPSRLDGYIDPRLRSVYHENPELFHTLTVLCGYSLNYQQTADELAIHPKTVRYRVERARELYGIDVRDPDDYLQVILSDKILSFRTQE